MQWRLELLSQALLLSLLFFKQLFIFWFISYFARFLVNEGLIRIVRRKSIRVVVRSNPVRNPIVAGVSSQSDAYISRVSILSGLLRQVGTRTPP